MATVSNKTCAFSSHKYFRLIYYLSAVLGTFPFSFHRGRYIKSNFFTVLSIIFSAYVGLGSVAVYYYVFFVNPKGTNFIEKADKFLILCFLFSQSVMYITTVSTSIWRVRDICQIIAILEEVDGCLKIPLKKNFCLLDLFASSLSLILVILKCYYSPNFISKTFFCILITNLWLSMSQFSVLASVIEDRLQGACESLNELDTKKESLPLDKKLATLCDVHNRLCDACETLQASFTWLLTVLVTVCFVGFNSLTFFIYKSQKLNENFRFLILLLDGKICWLLYFLTIIWKIVSSSTQLTKKTKEFNNILYQLMANDKSNQLMQNEKLLLHLSMKREVVLTACGLFNLDFTLVHSMAAAVATYLVMIIQFDK